MTNLEENINKTIETTWKETQIVKAILLGITLKKHDIIEKIAKGKIRNNNRTKGYIDALTDLQNALTEPNKEKE